MKRFILIVVLFCAVLPLVASSQVTAQGDKPKCDPGAVIEAANDLKASGDNQTDIDALNKLRAQIDALNTACSTNSGKGTPIPLPTATSDAGTRDNPVPQDTVYHFRDLGQFSVKSQWSKGNTGVAIVYISFTCDGPSSHKCDTGHLLLDAVGGSGAVYERVFRSEIPEPTFGGIGHSDVFGGGKSNGYAGFNITDEEDSLQLRVRIFLEDVEVFFDISGS